MHTLLLPLQPRFIAFTLVVLIAAALGLEFFLGFGSLLIDIPLVVFISLAVVGTVDVLQKRHAVLRNYPLSAHIRFILEEIRPEIRQYFLESEKDGTPFSRDKRAHRLSARQAGLGQAAVRHAERRLCRGLRMAAITRSRRSRWSKEPFRIVVGGPDCEKPYSASIFNISAMSFGALSPNAILALNGGAKKGDFAHDTGEGGYSPYHRENGGDIIWEIGSGYFCCRNGDGTFCADKFAAGATPRAGQDGRAQAQPRRQARPWRRAARRQGQSGDRRDPRRADRRRLHLAVAAFGVFDARSR